MLRSLQSLCSDVRRGGRDTQLDLVSPWICSLRRTLARGFQLHHVVGNELWMLFPHVGCHVGERPLTARAGAGCSALLQFLEFTPLQNYFVVTLGKPLFSRSRSRRNVSAKLSR